MGIPYQINQIKPVVWVPLRVDKQANMTIFIGAFQTYFSKCGESQYKLTDLLSFIAYTVLIHKLVRNYKQKHTFSKSASELVTFSKKCYLWDVRALQT